MPDWVQSGFHAYVCRFPREMPVSLIEIPALKRGKNTDGKRLTEKEGEAMLAAVNKGNHIIALDIPGETWNTKQLANRLAHWKQQGHDLSFLIGGADGLAPACKSTADQSWSLSPLTFPHPLVRIMLIETLYRAWSVTINHPYHRE